MSINKSPEATKGEKVAIVFLQFGPYHHARVKALQAALPGTVIPAQVASASRTYAWFQHDELCDDLVTLCKGIDEDVSPITVFFNAYRFFAERAIRTVFLPSYSPAQVFALYAAAFVCGCQRIMMNESHAGTGRATGWKHKLKRFLVQGFHSALVGGIPQKRYFESLGLPSDKVFTGYDAIDNDHFSRVSLQARERASLHRKNLKLPNRYILNLGRFVEKKNLELLVNAYANVCRSEGTDGPALVFVGSGKKEAAIKDLVKRRGLSVCEGSSLGTRQGGSVHFHGFAQINQTPIYYALAEFFVLPSKQEEWGLVVNEAMACRLPVLVSNTAGCCEDLVHDGVNGFRFNPFSVDELTKHISILAKDQEMRASMGIASEKLIENWGCENFAIQALKAIHAARV